MCSATALDATSSTLPYVDETETCIEAFHTTDSRHGPDDRGLSINIGWDENVAIDVYSDGEDQDIQECGELRSNHFRVRTRRNVYITQEPLVVQKCYGGADSGVGQEHVQGRQAPICVQLSTVSDSLCKCFYAFMLLFTQQLKVGE